MNDDWLIDQIFTLLWVIWERRNKWVHEHQTRPLWLMLLRHGTLVSVPLTTVTVDHAQHHDDGGVLARRRWLPPEQGKVKINIDAALSSVCLGMGMVARNHEGLLLAAVCAHDHAPLTVEMAEALVLRWAVSLALELGFFNVL